MGPLDLLATFGPWAVALIVTYVALKVAPLDKRVTKLEVAVEEHMKAQAHDASNYERWRGEVSTWLRAQRDDHQFIRAEIAKIRDLLDRRADA